jgi:gliding motility-associated-like protein
VRLKPVPVLGSNSPICTGSALNLTTTAPAGSTFDWTGPYGFNSGLQYPTIDPAITANSGTYSVVVTLAGCPSDTMMITVAVDTTPEAPVLTTNSPGAPGPTICEGDTLKFTSYSATAFTIYHWSGPAGFDTYTQNPNIPGATAASSGVYTLVASIGTCSATASISATVTPTPPISITSNTPICSGDADTLKLHAIGDPGSSYDWTGPYTFSSNAQDPVRTPAKAEYSGVYQVTVTTNNCHNTASHTVVVNQTPDVPWVKWLTYCQYYDAPYLQAVGSNLLWYSSSSGGTGIVAPPKPSTDVVGYSFYYVNQTVNDCPGPIDSIRVTVNPKPSVTVTDGATVCPHDSVEMIATNFDDIAYYKWSPQMYLSDTVGASVVAHPETDMNYMVITSNVYGCTDTATVAITVKASAVIHMDDSVRIYPGESYQIDPVTNCSIFSWSPSGGLSDKYIANPLATPEYSTRYVLTGITEWGCRTQDTISIIMNEDAIFNVPNAFAPGGVNGKFKVSVRGLATLRYFRVYDRWGVLVYEGKDIGDGWDGTYKGVPQPVGVYVYEVSAVSTNGKVYNKVGNVTLLR